MPEVSHAGKHHGQTVLIGSLYDFVVAHRTAGLDDRSDAGFCGSVDAVAEWEEGVGRHDRALDLKFLVRSLDCGDFGAVHTAHLARANTDRHIVLAEDNCIGLHVLDHGPGKQHVFDLFRCWCLVGDDLQVIGCDPPHVAALYEQSAGDFLEVESAG